MIQHNRFYTIKPSLVVAIPRQHLQSLYLIPHITYFFIIKPIFIFNFMNYFSDIIDQI